MIDEYEVYNLVRELYYLSNKDDITREEVDELDEETLEIWLYEKFEFGDWNYFVEFINELIKLVPPIQTGISNTWYHAFVSNNIIICRKEL